MTWRLEQRLCNCGAEFEARIATIDGEDAYASEQCPACYDITLRTERYAEAMDKLKAETDEQGKKWLTDCNCPVPLLVKTFDGFDKTRALKAHKLMSTWDWNHGQSIILQSQTYGVGKTHLCGALVNKILRTEPPARLTQDYYVQRRYCPVYFTTEPQLLDRIYSTFNRTDDNAETTEQLYKMLERRQVLIIDDVGKIKPRELAFVQGVYFRIIDTRCVSGKPIVMTSNLSLAELEEHIGGASADRLREMCGPNVIKISGISYRKGMS